MKPPTGICHHDPVHSNNPVVLQIGSAASTHRPKTPTHRPKTSRSYVPKQSAGLGMVGYGFGSSRRLDASHLGSGYCAIHYGAFVIIDASCVQVRYDPLSCTQKRSDSWYSASGHFPASALHQTRAEISNSHKIFELFSCFVSITIVYRRF